MTIEIRSIEPSELLDNAAELFQLHYEELAKHKDIMILKPNMAAYDALIAVDKLFIVGAFDDDHLVGYSVNFEGNHLHYADLYYAQNDLLFVDPAYRKGSIGLKLIHETERVAKERGAKLMLWHAKKETALASIMPRLEYGVQDIIYSKEL